MKTEFAKKNVRQGMLMMTLVYVTQPALLIYILIQELTIVLPLAMTIRPMMVLTILEIMEPV